MKKLLFIVLLLIGCIYYAFNYLLSIENESIAYIYRYDIKPLIYQKEELAFYEDENVDYSQYFDVFSFNDYSLGFKRVGDELNVYLKDDFSSIHKSYKITILEKPVIEVVKEVIIEKPVYIQSESHSTSANNSQTNDVPYIEAEQKPYVSGLKDYSFALGTSLSDIVYQISSNIETNVAITLDYAQVNTSCPGDYPLYLYAEGEIYTININIF